MKSRYDVTGRRGVSSPMNPVLLALDISGLPVCTVQCEDSALRAVSKFTADILRIIFAFLGARSRDELAQRGNASITHFFYGAQVYTSADLAAIPYTAIVEHRSCLQRSSS